MGSLELEVNRIQPEAREPKETTGKSESHATGSRTISS
jgi:hypothetical protein